MSVAVWIPAYIALGSNQNEPIEQVQRAFNALGAVQKTRLILRSSLYRSAPMGPQDQPPFVNAAAAVLTQLDARELLDQLHAIEQHMGRVRRERWGPRIIDLDLLMHGDTRSDSEDLKLPHPGMLHRNFVMAPLAEIAPHLKVDNRTAFAVAKDLGSDGLSRLS